MNLNQEKALFHLTGKLSLSQTGTEELRQWVDEAPYFAPARFFQTAKLRSPGFSDDWKDAIHGTHLYFTNPLWFSLQLSVVQNEIQQVDVDASNNRSVMELIHKEVPVAKPDISPFEENLLPPDASQEKIDEQTAEMGAGSADTDPTENKIAGILSSQLADFKKPIDPNAELDIDADRKRMHTIDYFASQGIKIDLSSIPQDKLTTHLRKFTDWLKQVKTAQGGSVNELAGNPEMEKAVVENAKISNETREIVTEAMADVLVKQGQTDKAIQLYIKLSFLNPEKSSYFAAKIEQLKGI